MASGRSIYAPTNSEQPALKSLSVFELGDGKEGSERETAKELIKWS
jgi:hypothetical protein